MAKYRMRSNEISIPDLEFEFENNLQLQSLSDFKCKLWSQWLCFKVSMVTLYLKTNLDLYTIPNATKSYPIADFDNLNFETLK